MTRVPDGVTPITAARGWIGSGPKRRLRLESLTKAVIWEPQQVMTANCEVARILPLEHHGGAPADNCRCGIYALNDPLYLEQRYSSPVQGVVEMWGKLIPGERGWRGEFAKVSAFVADTYSYGRDLRRLAKTYDVPILDRWPAMTPLPKQEKMTWTSELSTLLSTSSLYQPQPPSPSPLQRFNRTRALESRSRFPHKVLNDCQCPKCHHAKWERYMNSMMLAPGSLLRYPPTGTTTTSSYTWPGK